jgi:hypothetical protein
MPYCATCGEPFQSQGLFDQHRVGPFEPPGQRRCLTPDEMRAKGWRHDGKTWRGAPPKDDRFKGRAS